jgi:DNA-binding NtrC family response regulator
MSSIPTALIIDDEDSICLAFERFFVRRGWKVVTAPSADAGLRICRQSRPAVVFLDVRLPDRSGLDILGELIELGADVVVITAFGGLDAVIRAIQGRAYDYMVKPLDLDQAFALAERIRAARLPATERPSGPTSGPHETLIGSSPAMQEVYKRIARAADSVAPVLIEGQTGTGKELVARAIHGFGSRRDAPFAALNCGAIPETLIESELFGHVKGAFTGAEVDRCGRIESARHGSLLLDEVADLPLSMQVKLLRFLDSAGIERVGSSASIRVDVRILAATNKDLELEVAQGRFRRDLFFRLAVLRITVPPLRERKTDIPQLADHFLRNAARANRSPTLATPALEALVAHDWPGNVRELRSAIEHALAIGPGDAILADDLPPSIHAGRLAENLPASNLHRAIVEFAVGGQSGTDRWHNSLAEVERALVTYALKRSQGNQSEAAHFLGLHRNTLRNKLRELRVDPTGNA